MLKLKLLQNVFGKKDRNILDLPVLTEEGLDIENICKLWDSRTPLWTWYSIPERGADAGTLKEEEIRGLDCGSLDVLAMYRKEENLLCKYNAKIAPDSHEMTMRLDTIWPYKPTALLDVIRTYILPAHKVYQDPEHRTDTLMAYAHDLYAEDIEEYLQTHDCMHVTAEHFKKIDE